MMSTSTMIPWCRERHSSGRNIAPTLGASDTQHRHWLAPSTPRAFVGECHLHKSLSIPTNSTTHPQRNRPRTASDGTKQTRSPPTIHTPCRHTSAVQLCVCETANRRHRSPSRPTIRTSRQSDTAARSNSPDNSQCPQFDCRYILRHKSPKRLFAIAIGSRSRRSQCSCSTRSIAAENNPMDSTRAAKGKNRCQFVASQTRKVH